MKDDKICFSKTLTYLVLLVAVVFGAFYAMNFVNQKKVSTDTEAAGSFLIAAQKCKDLTGNVNSFCVPTTIAKKGGSYSTAILRMISINTGIDVNKYSSVIDISNFTCKLFETAYTSGINGLCVTLQKVGATTGTTNINPPIAQGPANNPPTSNLPVADCSKYGFKEVPFTAKTRIKDYCNNLNGTDYKIGAGNTCYTNSKTCASATNCETEACLRCINQQVSASNCTFREITCPYNATKNSIKSVVNSLESAINSADDANKNSRIDSARRQLLNYYALRSTTGYTAGTQPNTGGCVLKADKGSSCVDKPVSQDYCSCATWARTQDVVNDDCKNVIDWVSAGTYNKAP